MKKILLVESSPKYEQVVKESLQGGYLVTCAATASAALREIRGGTLDLLLLGTLLPEGERYHLCAQLAQRSETCQLPVFILSSKSDLNDKLVAFSLGVDDYLVEPFEAVELRARVEARLRKRSLGTQSPAVLRCGNLLLEQPLLRASAVRGKRMVDLQLTPTEFRLAYYLAAHTGRVFSRQQLLQALWGDNLQVMERTVDTHVSTLRRKLGELADYIRAVPGAGYCLQTEMDGNPAMTEYDLHQIKQ